MNNKIVLQTSKKFIDKHVKVQLMQHAPGWEYIYMNDDQIINFFKNNKTIEFPKIIKKFKQIKDGPHKADLFRYYFLYINGGFFVDSDLEIYKNLDLLVEDYDFVSARQKERKTIFNGLLYVKPNNQIILECLRHLYRIDIDDLHKNYFAAVNFLNDIIDSYNDQYKIKLYEERIYGNVAHFYDDQDNIIATHYWKSKVIPKR